MAHPWRHRSLWLLACLPLLSALAWLPGDTHPGRGSEGERRSVDPSGAAANAVADNEREYFHWSRLPVRVYMDVRPGPETQWARVALAGFAEWPRATDGAVGFQVVDTPAQAQITVRFTPGPTVPGRPDLVGLTTTYWVGPVLTRADVVLAAGGRTPTELQLIAAHEFGHALGIRGHSAEPADVMFPSLSRPCGHVSPAPKAGTSDITAHDVDTLARCYPALLAPKLSSHSR